MHIVYNYIRILKLNIDFLISIASSLIKKEKTIFFNFMNKFLFLLYCFANFQMLPQDSDLFMRIFVSKKNIYAFFVSLSLSLLWKSDTI